MTPFRPPLPEGSLVTAVGGQFVPVGGNPPAPFQPPQPPDLDSLPPERQQAVRAAMQQLSAGLTDAAAPPGEYPDIQPPPSAPSEPAPTGSAGSAGPQPSCEHCGALSHCQHCGWERTRPDPEEPTDTEKLAFVDAVVFNRHFTRTYSLLGGRIQVTFRTLTASEADLAFTQAAHDANAGNILHPGEYFRVITDYRLCLGLTRYETPAGAVNLPASSDYQIGDLKPGNTVLKHIVPHVYDKVLGSDSIRRAVAVSYERFCRLVEKLEGHADDPDFWPATADSR